MKTSELKADRARLEELLAARDEALAEVLDDLLSAVTQLRQTRRSVAATIVKMGAENNYCDDHMAEFLSEALGIDMPEARELLDAAKPWKTYQITIHVKVKGNEHDSITYDEAKSFAKNALGADTVEVDLYDCEAYPS